MSNLKTADHDSFYSKYRKIFADTVGMKHPQLGPA